MVTPNLRKFLNAQDIENFSPWPGKKSRKSVGEDMGRKSSREGIKKSSGLVDHGQRSSPQYLESSDGDVSGGAANERQVQHTPEPEMAVHNKKPRHHHGERPGKGGYREAVSTRPAHESANLHKSVRHMPAAGSGRSSMRSFSRSPDYYSRSREYDGRESYTSYGNDRRKGMDWEDDRSYSDGPPDQRDRSPERCIPKPLKLESRNDRGGTGSSRKEARKFVEVDRNGNPYGCMLQSLHMDLQAFSKEMDPSLNWDGQPQEARDRLEGRVYAEYDILGDASTLNEKYIKGEVGKALIQNRFKLGKLIDSGQPKPRGFPTAYWENVKTLRSSEEAKKISYDNAQRAKGRGVRNSTIEKIRKSWTEKLVRTILLAEVLHLKNSGDFKDLVL